MLNTGLSEGKRVAYFEYDFSIHGGAVGAISVDGDVIPAGAVITGGIIDCEAAVTGGAGATLAISAVGANDIYSAGAIAAFALNALLVVVPVPQTANTWVRIATALTALTFTVAVNALTAGRVKVGLEYLMPR